MFILNQQTKFLNKKKVLKKYIYTTPVRLVVTLLVSIFFSETLIMFILQQVPNINPAWEPFIDSLLLVILVSPVLYFYVFLPQMVQIDKLKNIENNLTEQLINSQKMISLGMLSGRIAHDMNNIHSSILVNTEIALENISATHPVYSNLKTILAGCEEASVLTHQILSFSNKNSTGLQKADIHQIIHDITDSIIKVIGKDIYLEVDNGENFDPVYVNKGQIGQAIINLAINARNAMPYGGRLKIKTGMEEIKNANQQNNEETKPGSYITVSVTDTGIGIDKDGNEISMDSFYITDNAEKMDKLSLACVYSIVMEHEGYLWFENVKGKGTTFKIYFPIHIESSEKMESCETERSETLKNGNETILIVDDDPTIRKFLNILLQNIGYQAIEASSGDEALILCDTYKEKIDCLLTDIIMPEMNGNELARLFQIKRPDTKILFMTGYSKKILSQQNISDNEIDFMQKPFTAIQLSEKLRAILDHEMIKSI